MIIRPIPLILYPIQMNFGSSNLTISQHVADAAVAPTTFDAVDFAHRLSKLSTFLPAAHELLSFLSVSQDIIPTRKTIRLLEVARKTLERAGIVLYSFASCPEVFVEHKKTYIDLLKLLQTNVGQENTEMRGRIRILLMPLTSNFFVEKRRNSVYISPKRHLRTTSDSSCSSEGTQTPGPSSSAAQPAIMLPPDAFPAIVRPQSSLPIRDSPIRRRRSPLWDYHQLEKSPISKERLDQENIIVTETVKYRAPKMLRQFGIYCTGRNSMDKLNHFWRNERQTFVL
ncbi:hypothetical protein BYT27DRAFT_7333163 [Phlegmacium glaucopus]|nr:hypothetical protein BYT27DRAFT_7333163 [Phlegmacium glaucopus]